MSQRLQLLQESYSAGESVIDTIKLTTQAAYDGAETSHPCTSPNMTHAASRNIPDGTYVYP
ncbi:hypothetical protein K435DRAFT_877927 [Dendrothele bispora CBS 962.96]|uniref:Uncharacterized protein n=1 Tax=Dendrothele bispora (strain CBS 962.96) TaxID=1314807 RepID=A0A4S8KP11_DENBC|nr:hypothetical protein K435DRAFT_877927 [Dendrothele bispora CBS 962.96]